MKDGHVPALIIVVALDQRALSGGESVAVRRYRLLHHFIDCRFPALHCFFAPFTHTLPVPEDLVGIPLRVRLRELSLAGTISAPARHHARDQRVHRSQRIADVARHPLLNEECVPEPNRSLFRPNFRNFDVDTHTLT